MALLPSWRGGLLLLFVDFRWHGFLSGRPFSARTCGVTPPWVFSTEKRRAGFFFGGSRPCGSRYPFRAPMQTASLGLPCSMPPVCGSRLDRQPDSRLQPTRPQLYGPTAQDPPVTHHTPGFWPGRSRICLDAGSQPIAGPPSPEHPHMHPPVRAGCPSCV